MTVHIQNIQVKNLGPLDSLQESLGQVNLIYGRNETGKTYLVEYLLHSLFRHAKTWDLRGKTGQGAVQVIGLGPDPVAFSPDKKRKIESYWEEDGAGLPLNMARFLVVKGGELAFTSHSPGGVSRDVLKSALTSQALLDQLWASIPATVRDAELDQGQIKGNNRGLIKTQTELLDEIQDLNQLLKDIDQRYSRGPAFEIEKQLAALQSQLTDQGHAKRHQAYGAWTKLGELDQQRETLSVKHIQELRDSIRDLAALDKDIAKLEADLQEAEDRSQEYRWLESAQEIWEEKGLDQKGSPPAPLGIAGLTGLGIGAILLLIENFFPVPELIWIGGATAALGLGLGIYYGIQHYRWSQQIDDSRERKTIQEEFREKFNRDLGGMADLKAQKALLQEHFISAQTTRKLITEKTAQRLFQSQSIENSFQSLTGETVPPERWQEQIAGLTERSNDLDKEIIQVRLELSKLDVPENEFLQEPNDVVFDPGTIQELEAQIQKLEASLTGLESELETLKVRACERTGDEITSPWRAVLSNLQDLLGGQTEEYRRATAQIVAQIGLSQVLTRLRAEEDHKINQAIQTAPVSQILFQISGRYKKLEMVDDQLQVEDDLSTYSLADLSTGAREQVQLALRLGIASELCGGNPLFLILDDAFQHSDWQRREKLVQSTLGLARGGWQILYLTMDDHIRDLFLKEVKPVLKKGFKLIELN